MTGRPRMADPIARQLLEEIVTEAIPPGAALPTEPALGERFDVSRTVIREAVRMLEQREVVAARQGRGTAVLPRRDWDLMDPLVLSVSIDHDTRMELQDELAQLRIDLEGRMAEQAARRVDEDRSTVLASALADLRGSRGDEDRYLDLDFALHGEVMRQSGDVLAFRLIMTVHSQIRGRLRALTHASPAELRRTHEEHAELVDAIRSAEPDRARTAMATHIAEAWARRRRQLAEAHAVHR